MDRLRLLLSYALHYILRICLLGDIDVGMAMYALPDPLYGHLSQPVW